MGTSLLRQSIGCLATDVMSYVKGAWCHSAHSLSLRNRPVLMQGGAPPPAEGPNVPQLIAAFILDHILQLAFGLVAPSSFIASPRRCRVIVANRSNTDLRITYARGQSQGRQPVLGMAFSKIATTRIYLSNVFCRLARVSACC
jgi:hypothetical protein